MFNQRLADTAGLGNMNEHNSLNEFFKGKEPPGSLSESLLSITQVCDTADGATLNIYPEFLEAATQAALSFAESVIINADRNNMSAEVRNSVNSLTVNEAAAVCLYTMEFGPYIGLNKILRVENRQRLPAFVDYLLLLMHGLSKCPKPTSAIVYRRGPSDVISRYIVGSVITWTIFSSCATNLAVLENAIVLEADSVRTYFQITLTTSRARNIRHLNVTPGEDEILLPPNTRLRVMDKTDQGGGVWVVQLLELPCLDPILVFPDQSGRLLYRRDLHNIPPAP